MGLLRSRGTGELAGCAQPSPMADYCRQVGRALDPGHYSDFRGGFKLSAIGLGTFPGSATDAVDAAIAQIIEKGLTSGLNVIDTAPHYRYGRSLIAVGQGLKRAVAAGIDRKALWLMSKSGFVPFPGGPPADPAAFVQEHIIGPGLATVGDCVPGHVLSPQYARHQLDVSRAALGVETLDGFLVDQPEVQIPAYGKAAVLQRIGAVFCELERAVADGVLQFYGVSSFHAFRAHTDDTLFMSLASLVALAEKAAKVVTGHEHDHHLALIELPFNAVLLDGFSRFNQVTGAGNEACTLQAALQLKLYTIASHGLFKGHLAQHELDVLQQAMPKLANSAQRALQFNRSTPGLGTTLVGLSTPAHLDDVLAVARTPVLPHATYMALYKRAES